MRRYTNLKALLASIMTRFNANHKCPSYLKAKAAAAAAETAAEVGAEAGAEADSGQGSGATGIIEAAEVAAGGEGSARAAAGTGSAAPSTSDAGPLPRWSSAAGELGQRANDAGVPFESPNEWKLADTVQVGDVRQTRVAFILNTLAELEPGPTKAAATHFATTNKSHESIK